MWERYCRGVQAIVFVIDAADADSLEQARNELQSLLQKPSLQGIPLLVLGNKNDIAGALSTGELIDRLNLKVIATFLVTCMGALVLYPCKMTEAISHSFYMYDRLALSRSQSFSMSHF